MALEKRMKLKDLDTEMEAEKNKKMGDSRVNEEV